ncbi:MAG: NF038122 family metalloprotease [Planctomycetota bacterium]
MVIDLHRALIAVGTAACAAVLVDAAAAQALPGPLADRPRVMLKPLCGVTPIGNDVPGPVVGGWDVLQLSQADIDQLIANRGEPVVTVVSRGGAAARSPGLTVVFNAFGDVTQDAIDGMQLVADYYASRVMDPVTVTFEVDFQPEFVGGAGPAAVNISYAELRQRLIDDADADDTIQALLPTDAVPARRFIGGTISQETEFIITTANAKALGIDLGADPPVDALLFIGSELDGDPSDGLGNGAAAPGGTRTDFSLVDVLVHEVGHSLGFVNFIEFGFTEMTPLDLFRFTELGADNPSDAAEFASVPRAIFLGDTSPASQQQFDFIVREHLASNGFPFQASHFRETNFDDPTAPRVGVMEAAITAFETGFPEYFSVGDFDAFDAIGWDIVTDQPCLPDVNGDGNLTPGDFNAWVLAFNTQSPACDQNGDDQCTPGDFNAWVLNFNAGC